MKKLLEIDCCFECHQQYVKYFDDGKLGKLWCARLKKELHPILYKFDIDKDCPLPDVEEKQTVIEKLLSKKASEDNIIDLNAYALGAGDMYDNISK